MASIELPPTTFNEKVRYRMATDRREILTIFADKVAVRQYVSEKVGDHVLPQLYAVTSDPETLDRSKLPREFVLKASHGSGGTIIVADHASREQRLPHSPHGWERFQIHPEYLDWDRLVKCCRYWLGLRYMPRTEWAYSKVKPRILVEELLVDDGQIPKDYKLMVFGGKVELIWVDQDRFLDHRRNFYSARWEALLDVAFHYPRGAPDSRPPRLEEMVAVAERLGDQIDFIRVDLYNIGERVVFGEITNYPEGGSGSFTPPEFDEQLGRLWILPNTPLPDPALRAASSPTVERP